MRGDTLGIRHRFFRRGGGRFTESYCIREGLKTAHCHEEKVILPSFSLSQSFNVAFDTVLTVMYLLFLNTIRLYIFSNTGLVH